jgi:hypothetical protein
MVKLIIQKEETPDKATTKSSVCLVKFPELLLQHPILVLSVGILGFLGKGAAALVRYLGVETAEGFSFFPLSLVLWAIC